MDTIPKMKLEEEKLGDHSSGSTAPRAAESDANANASAGAKRAKGFDDPDNPMTKAAEGAIHVAGAFGGLAALIGGIAVKILLTGASTVIAPAYILRDMANKQDPGEAAKQGVPKLNMDKVTKMHDQESDNIGE